MPREPVLVPLKYTIPLRIDEPMHSDMKDTAGRFHSTDGYALRFAAAVGFKVIKHIKHEVPEAVVDRFLSSLIQRTKKKSKKPKVRE